jgi:hypothetical protein
MVDIGIPLVLVQIGRMPNYLVANLRYISETFRGQTKYLITDVHDTDSFTEMGFEVVKIEDLDLDWPANFEICDERKHFRKNFWFSTKARLIIIPVFMRERGIEKILHIESDVWIHPKFPFDYFLDIKEPLAFPRVDLERGVASVLFINGVPGIQTLSDACEIFPELTDMQILGKILEDRRKAHQLDSYEFDLNTSHQWIFDGAKIGMYLFGSDPRNNWGIIKRFHNSPMGGLSKGDQIVLIGDELFIKGEKSRKQVVNLHIHSKDLRIFSRNWQEVIELQLESEEENKSISFRFQPFAFHLTEIIALAIRKALRILRLQNLLN